jgi:hypothetical protein
MILLSEKNSAGYKQNLWIWMNMLHIGTLGGNIGTHRHKTPTKKENIGNDVHQDVTDSCFTIFTRTKRN